MKKGDYVMVRTYSAGVFAGEFESREGKEVVLKNARRIWYWDGAASLSELAQRGTSKPENCKFPMAIDEIILTEAIELIPITIKAKKSYRYRHRQSHRHRHPSQIQRMAMTMALANKIFNREEDDEMV